MKKPIWKKIICIMLCLVIILPLILITAGYLYVRLNKPNFERVFIPLDESKVINGFYECKDEMIYLAEYIQSHPEHYVRWSYVEPDILRVGVEGKEIKTDTDKKLQESLDVLKKEGYYWINKTGNKVAYERWSCLSLWQGIVYCKSDPKEYYKSEYISECVIKETDVKNFYYCIYSEDLG